MNLSTNNPVEKHIEHHRRLEDKVNDVIHVQEEHSEQLERIENAFHEHIKRQVTLVSEIKTSLVDFMAGIEETVVREISKIKK